MKFESIQDTINKNVEGNSRKTAVEFGDKTCSYAQIYHSSNIIAGILNSIQDIEESILVFVDKKPFLIEAILGIIKAGKVFIPVSERIPQNRLKIIMDETKSNWILTEAQYLDRLNQTAEIRKENLNVLLETPIGINIHEYEHLNIYSVEDFLLEQEDISATFQDSCYIYFTSGSTGKPKGVLGRHTSLKHFIDWEIEQFGVDESFRVSQLITPAFDPFLRDIFVPLCAGATICIPEDEDMVMNPRKLVNWIDKNNITLIHMVPTLFKAMVNELQDAKHFHNLKYILLAGEPLKGKDLDKFYRLFGSRIQLVNMYGPTETTLAKAFYMIGSKDASRINIPIGKPISDTELLVLDGEMKPCTQGDTGEIYIRTPYMSSGYLNDKALTDSVFIKNPFSEKITDIIYKTGDLGRRLQDGNIECLGRLDNQTKIRGMRLEITEIEVQLLKIASICEAVVVVHESEDGDKVLYAFITGEAGIDKKAIRDALLKELPDYMIPSYFVQLDKIPQLPNGKIDRNYLRRYELADGNVHITPRNAVEERLTAIWKDVLRVRKAGVTDDFLLSGGHSLKAAYLSLRIHKEFDVEMSVKDIFKNPTIEALALFIEKSAKSSYTQIPAAAEAAFYPVSSAQKRLYLIHMIENAGVSYNMPEALLIEGCPDIGKLEGAFRSIIERHEALRTSFGVMQNEIVQYIQNSVCFKLEYTEQVDRFGDEHAAANTLMDDFIRPFDLSTAPLFRVRLVKIAENKYVLLRDMHHIISDGISEEILKDDFVKFYNNQQPYELKVQYKDFAIWHREVQKSERVGDQEKYWLELLSEELPVLDMPTDFTRPQKQSFEGDMVRFCFGREFSEKINRVARENRATTYMVLLAAFNILLSRYTGQEDILVGSPAAGRNHAGIQNTIGVFINTLVMRNYPIGNKTFEEFLNTVKENTIKAFDNQDCQFETLTEKLKITRDFSRNPLFDVMFIMHNMHFEEMLIEGLTITRLNTDRKASKFDITLTATDTGNGLECCLEYCTRLYWKESIERMAGHFMNILKQAADDTGIMLSKIDMLSGEERKQLLNEFNSTYAEYPSDKPIHRLFMQQAAKAREKIALVSGGRVMTYGELDERSGQLALCLQKKGIKAGRIVGILLPRCLEMMIGIMGVLKAGGAYLPIDPGYPPERIRYMMEHSGTDILLTKTAISLTNRAENEKPLYKSILRGSLDGAAGRNIEIIDLADESSYCKDGSQTEVSCGPDDLAYVIYTSGSTGRPKGVMIRHRNVSNLIKGFTDRIDFSEGKTILCLTTVSFDIFVLETLVPLAAGCRIVIADETQQLDPAALCGLIRSNGVNMLQITPSRLQMLLQTGIDPEQLESIKELIIGGEAFPETLLHTLNKLEHTRIYNVYGPTETTVWSTLKELTGCGRVNIGKPIANTQAYILDKCMRIQPIGVTGELYLGGEGLSAGYLNMPEMTAERFIPNPFDDSSLGGYSGKGLIYRTGDLARFLPDGEIEYLGRTDTQVKVRGYRVELSEIEKCLMEHPRIINNVCAVKEEQSGGKYLAAFYLADEEIPVSEMRSHLLKFLPDYMVPQSYTRLEKFPATLNGKIDRKSLPEPERAGSGMKNKDTGSMTGTEKKIAAVWSSILNLDSIGIYDNFFDIGGNSLLLVLMHNRIEGIFPGKAGIGDIFANPTVSMLAQFISSQHSDQAGTEILPLKLPREFLTDSEEHDNFVFEYTLKGELYESIMAQGMHGFEPEIVLVSIYVCLLGEVTGQDNVAVQKLTDRAHAVQLAVQLSGMEDATRLFEHVSSSLQTEAVQGTYPLRNSFLKKAAVEEDQAIAAFTDIDTVGIRDFDRCHFLLKAGICEGFITLEFQYDSSKVKTEKASDLFKWYIKTAELIMNQIRLG